MAPLVIDTDCGIDDAVALWWAVTSPHVELLGISTIWGNVDVRTAATNVCRILHAAERADISVAIGRGEPWGPRPQLRPADFIHGADGIADLGWPPPPLTPGDEPAVDLLRRVVDARPAEVTVVTLGPLGNIAAAVDADPSWATRVKRLVVMGGTVLVQGNALPVGEANIANDPHAAAVTLAAAWREPPVLVGLDATLNAPLSTAFIELAREHRTPAAAYLAEMLAFYAPHGGTFSEPGEFPCHDALATALAVFPERMNGPVLPTAVETNAGPAQGMTVVDRRQPFFARGGQAQAMPAGFHPAQIVMEVDADWFRTEIRHLFGG